MTETSITKKQIILRLFIISSPLLLNDFYLRLVPEDAVALKLVLDVMVYIFWQSTLIYLAFRARWFTVSDLGLSRERIGKQILSGFIILALVSVVSLVIDIGGFFMERSFHIKVGSVWYFPVPDWHPVPAFFYVLYLSITAGVYEEIVYRGIIISQLRYVTAKPWILVTVSALVFTIIHWSMGPGTWIIALLFGAFWAWLFLRQGKLLPIMIAHFLYDFLSIYGIPGQIMSGLGLK
ncbi:MAG: hypothetical protein CVV44_06920 [Spirochaetae bacterium HGW-Spirochaetae-1]|jgi:hypothetical protein|nr:MAG: hypothetical protein CVV44_06920 [Spirochaetae bacterium HGW-Spirochaetae-1]